MNQQNTRKPLFLLAPRFWPTWAGLALLRLIHTFPHSARLWFGRKMGRAIGLLAKRRLKIARRNIELCFPSKTEQEREEIVSRNFEYLGISLIEGAMSWWSSPEEILAQVEFEGSHHLDQALETGRGVILLSAHMTSLEIGVHIMGLKFGMAIMYRPLKNPVMDRLIRESREKHSDSVFPRSDTRAMIRSLKQGKAVFYGFDQDYGARHSIFAPFFGIKAATITATTRFAKATGAIVVPYFPYQTDAGRYHVEILPPVEDFPGESIEADTRRLNEILEKAILKAPEQYLWIHRRFKTRPEGEADVYN
ncbi:MAG: LpxL/LpxP family Kdo(2)-lipid IV(A) lauroyl/palmitoleoyl acyltransferase [Sedimenticola sp.]